MQRDLTKNSVLEAIRNLFAFEKELADDTSTLDVVEIEGSQMPEPYRGLLVHASDMTHKLQAFAGQRIHVRVLHMREEGARLERRVLLICDDDDQIVEFGAIRIHLDRFPEAAREEIRGAHIPLGAILKRHAIAHRCEPRFYFRLKGSDFLKEAFQLEVNTALYGRLNHILGAKGEKLADVVEVLPPLEFR